MYPSYPAAHPLEKMLVVGNTNYHDQLSGESSWGKKTVDILAPGDHILSTLPNGKYGYMSGTSMATPVVAGVVALIKSAAPNLSHTQIRDVLFNSGDENASLNGLTSSGKTVNALAAVQAAQGL